jgi:hypothetical protein
MSELSFPLSDRYMEFRLSTSLCIGTHALIPIFSWSGSFLTTILAYYFEVIQEINEKSEKLHVTFLENFDPLALL